MTISGGCSFGRTEGARTGSWNVAVRPNDGLSNATKEEQYTANTPVDTSEFISGDKRLSDASPDLIRLAPSQTVNQREAERAGQAVEVLGITTLTW